MTLSDQLKGLARFSERSKPSHLLWGGFFVFCSLSFVGFWYSINKQNNDQASESKKKKEFVSGDNQVQVGPSVFDQFTVLSSPSRTTQPVTSSSSNASDSSIDRGRNQAEEELIQRSSAIRADNERVAAVVGGLERKIDDAMNALELVERTISDLLSSDDGRRIASDATLLEKCIDVIIGQSLNKDSVRSLQDRLYAGKSTLATAGTSSKDRAVEFSSLSNLGIEIERTQKEFEIARKTFERWISMSSANPVSGKTLQEIIDQRESDRFVRTSRENRLKIDAQKDKLEAVKANIEIAKVQTEEKKRQDELDFLREKEKVRTAEQNKQLAILKLQQDFEKDWLEMQSLLAPFISEGMSTFVHFSGDKFYFEQTGRRELLSISTIQSSGALNDSEAGFERLLYIATHEFNKRNKGTFPVVDQIAVKKDPRVKPKLLRVQELLSKYGDILVEKGLFKK